MGVVTQFHVLTALLVVVTWLGIVTYLRLRRQSSIVYLLFVTLFYAYVIKVIDYTLFQFQSLLILRHFLPGLLLNGQSAGNSVNLVPLITLTPADLKTSLLNIVLLVPFGFGLPFLVKWHVKKVVCIGALFSIAIECLQAITGAVAHMTFRIADINDVLFNTAGAAIGYMLFVGFVRLCRHTSPNWQMPANPILCYLARDR